MTLCAEHLTPDHGAVAAQLFSWGGNPSSRHGSLPLRLAGGLHALRLRGDPGLAAVYPPEAPDDAMLWAAVSDAIRRGDTFLLDWIRSPPQTNEVGRSAVFRAAGQWLAARWGLPLDLCELGASAGLNLNWDRYALHIGARRFGPEDAVVVLAPDWTGPPPPAAEPLIAARRGTDLNPVNPVRDGDRLRAYCWPDQLARLARLEAALAATPAPVDRVSADDWLDALPEQAPGTARMICHSVAWQYFPPDVQARAQARIDGARRGGDGGPAARPRLDGGR